MSLNYQFIVHIENFCRGGLGILPWGDSICLCGDYRIIGRPLINRLKTLEKIVFVLNSSF